VLAFNLDNIGSFMEPSSKKKNPMVVGSNGGVEVRDQLVALTN